MINILKKLYSFLERKQKKASIILFLLILISMVIETFSVGLIVPAITLFSEENLITKYPYFSKILAALSPSHLFDLKNSNPIKNQDVVIGGMMIFILTYLIKSIFLFFLYYIKGNYIYSLRTSLSKNLINGYMRLPYSFFCDKNYSQLIRTVVDESMMVANTIDAFMSLFIELLVLIGILSLLFYFQPLATIVVISILLTCAFIYQKITKKIVYKLGRERKIYEFLRLDTLNKALGSLREIKVYNVEKRFVESYMSSSSKIFRSDKWHIIMQSLPRLWLELVAVFCLTIIAIFLLKNNSGQISVISTLALFAGAAFRLLPSVNRAITSLERVRYFVPALNHVYEEMENIKKLQKDIIKKDKTNFNQSIELKNIDFRYDNSEKKILDNINFKLNIFSSACIIGESGSGKTTLANILLGLLKPTNGEILINNKISKNNSINWGEEIGYVPQNVFLTNDTIRKNIAFGVPDENIDEEKIKMSLKFARLEKVLKELKEGANTIVGEKGMRFSGGEVQRIGIARALYHNPNFLLLDEPTSSLDLQTEKEFMEIVEKISDKKTIIIISHHQSILKFCNNIYKMDQGKLEKVN